MEVPKRGKEITDMPTKAADYLDEKTLDGLNKDEPSNRELADGIKLILRKLWSEEDMKQLIERKHKGLCEHCPLRTAPVPVHDADPSDVPDPITRRRVMMAVIKSSWFWIPVATGCAILCAKYGISLPMVGRGQ